MKLVSILLLLRSMAYCVAFTISTRPASQAQKFTKTVYSTSPYALLTTSTQPLHSSNLEDPEVTPSDNDVKLTLEEKMKKWEASEEEIKAASLGGVVPGRTDAFDVGLYIAFPFIVLTSLGFAFFPFIMDKIDVNSVGPPPTV
mmetsp:Transcript_3282/g.4210  ORF Transcript_3282/g.4210 Transcript_3282/m.4210 type:complete len:143 (+) Transcript_3282:173-601(+)|eukprot:CAMPEP_0172498622 /NCGR_PEP_ID=MMETSP1066-20121228/114491_1 /TAXON_ID=671091 /ORGANISM="Coscinodiscus wailesii, Strain CCMP2513" /LENGTH=142 /DNA_ID=CAMNT_0013271955 /DNA_START=135 /DNA_END=563 /DNA_ORIENTATION=-